MPPKFQSSFIPTGPVAAAGAGVIPQAKVSRQHDLLGFLAKLVFTLSLLLAVGVVGYRWYLGYSIGQMSAELEAARQEVTGGLTTELIRLNDRIVSTQDLLSKHRALTPVFSFLASSTPKSVRFTDFSFLMGKDGPQLILKGEAKSYSALAFEADVIEKSKNFRNPVFSDIRLDEKGNVSFSLTTPVAASLISYDKTVGRTATSSLPAATTRAALTATSTASTTAASTTSATSTASSTRQGTSR